jgi:16S rRNA (cytosine967-C5)-methyltransferase
MSDDVRVQLLLNDRHVRSSLLEITRITARQRGKFSKILQEALRNRKNLSSKRRRAVADGAYSIMRMTRKVDFLLSLGAQEAHVDVPLLSEEEMLEARYACTLVAAEGLEPYDVLMAGFCEAVSRILLGLGAYEQRIANLDSPELRLSIESSMPLWFTERMVKNLGAEDATALLHAMNKRAPLTVRCNLMKATREEVQRRLKSEEVESTKCPLIPWALQLTRHVNIRALHSFRMGLIEAQDSGSQWISKIVDPPKQGRVLDYCAGAGGKTLGLGMMMANRGELLATDIEGRRLRRSHARVARSGLRNVVVHPAGTKLPRSWRKATDRVLVDAPCSGSGTLRRVPEKRYTMTPERVTELTAIQRSILDEVAPYVAKNGRLIYATCSLFPEENEDVVASFLDDYPGFKLLPLSETMDPQVAQTIGDGSFLKLRPDLHNTDGFFAAILARS